MFVAIWQGGWDIKIVHVILQLHPHFRGSETSLLRSLTPEGLLRVGGKKDRSHRADLERYTHSEKGKQQHECLESGPFCNIYLERTGGKYTRPGKSQVERGWSQVCTYWLSDLGSFTCKMWVIPTS